jgi:hypothetical protein
MKLDISALLEKVATANLRLNPHVLDVVTRVKTAGLHRTAAALHTESQPMSIKTAAGLLGAKLLENSRRRQKIAAGISALNALDSNG